MSKKSSALHSSVVFFALAVLVMLLAGCQTTLPTGKGERLMPAAQISLVQGGVQNGTYQSDDLSVAYKYNRSTPETLEISGNVTFSDAMQENFTLINFFNLGVYLADSSGSVLGMRDLAGAGGVNFTTGAPTNVTFSKTLQIPTATAMMGFRYTGRAESDMRGSPTDFFGDPVGR